MDPQLPPTISTQENTPDPYLQAQNNSSNGNRKIIIIAAIVLVIIGVLSTIGYLYSQNAQLKKEISSLQSKNNELQSKNNTMEAAANQLAANTVQNSQNKNFFDITDFGVRFKTSADLADPVDVINTTLGTTGFSSQGLMNAAFVANANPGTSTTCSPGDKPLGSIIRGKTGQAVQSTTFDKVPGAIKIGEFYYVLVAPQGTCSQDTTTQTLQTKQVAAFKTAFTTLEAIPAPTKQ